MTSPILEKSVAGRSSPRAWLELLRLPNLATAWADVLMGFFVTHADDHEWPILLLLLGASSGCYLAGMVLNDVFDVEVDRVERPGRPIPSGRISLASARAGGILLLTGGVVCGWIVSALLKDWRAGSVATILALAVWLYDGPLKRLPIAPLVMGSCRTLNVLLGMSAAAVAWHPMFWLIAAGLGVYIAGVTWYARTEARESNRLRLAFGILMMIAGIGLIAWFPAWRNEPGPLVNPPGNIDPVRWRLLIALLAAMICWRAVWGVVEPKPKRVQLAIKQAILSVIVLDASICFVFRDFDGALPILLLLLPAMWLGRWIYST